MSNMYFWLGKEGYVDEVDEQTFKTNQEQWEGDRPQDFGEGWGGDIVSRGSEKTLDDPSKVGKGAIKYDAGKPCVHRGLIQYFPRAGNHVAEVSTFGANKYAWKGWEQVDDGINRYSDAMMRHLLYEAMGEEIDPDSGLMHAAHTAWNAMARLELILREKETNNNG